MLKELFNLKNYYFNPYAVPVLLAGFAVSGLGLLVFLNNPRQHKNRAFFYFCSFISGWLFFASLNYFSKKPEVALFWYKYFSYNFVLLVAPLTYLMGLSWSEELYQKYKRVFYFFLGLFGLIVLLNLHPNLIITGVKKHFYGYYVIFDTLGIITLPFWFILMVLEIINLLNIYKKETSPIKKRQVKTFLLGHFLGYTSFIDFLPAIFPDKEIYTSGYISFISFVIMTYYSIVRYRFLEIDTVLHQTILWLASILLLVLPLSLAISLSSGWFMGINPVLRVIILSAALFFFLTYYNRLKPKIDHLFRRRRYDYQKTLVEIPTKIGTELELNSLANRLFRELKEILYLQSGLLLVKFPENTDYAEVSALGYAQLIERGILKAKPVSLSVDSCIIKYLSQFPQALEKEQLEADPQYQPIKIEAQTFFQENALELLIPILLKGNLSGLIGLGKKENLQNYTLKDIQLLAQLGQSLGITLDNALHHQDIVEKERLSEELRLGREIQMELIPKQVPEIEGLKLAGLMQPAKEIGGDYFDYLPKAKDRIAIVIGDVSGKGVAAGLLMAVAKTAVYSISLQALNPKEIIIATNNILYQYMQGEKFMTLLYLEYINQEKKIIYSSAGHEHILHYDSKQNRCLPIKSGGFMLGMLPEIAEMLEEKELHLASGDKIVLYTDGVIEAEDSKRQRFGLNRLIKAVEKHSQKNAQELLDSLYLEVKNFIAGYTQYDDITLITMEVGGKK